jgi:hypothetical protein
LLLLFIDFVFISLYAIYLAEGIQEVLLKAVQGLEITQHRILNMLPASVLHISLTPSQATDVKNDGFNKIMDALFLDIPIYPTDCDASTDETKFSGFTFDWNWAHGLKESDVYEPFCTAVEHFQNDKETTMVAVSVGNGQRLLGGFLFKTSLWSLREFDSTGKKTGKVAHRGDVRGRTDIVLMDANPSGDIARHNVRIAVEVKLSSEINTPAKKKSASREAMTQILGLCGDNSNNSPPVVLTDFCQCFGVFYLERLGKRYAIKVVNCADIESALNVAYEVSLRPSVGIDFGRPDTPSGSEDDYEKRSNGSSCEDEAL